MIHNSKRIGLISILFIMFSTLLVFQLLGCKTRTVPVQKKELNRMRIVDDYISGVYPDINYDIDIFTSMNSFKNARYYMGFIRANDSVLVVVFVCQKNGADKKIIPTLFDVEWRDKKIGILTGYEYLMVHQEPIRYYLTQQDMQDRKKIEDALMGVFTIVSPAKKIAYYTNSEIISDTANFVFGQARYPENDGKPSAGVSELQIEDISWFNRKHGNKYDRLGILPLFRDMGFIDKRIRLF